MIQEERDRETLKCAQLESFNTFLKTGFLVESVLRRKTKRSWPASLRLKRYRKSGEKRSGNKKKEKRAIYKLIETIKFRVKSRIILFLIDRSKRDLRAAEETVYYLLIYYTVVRYSRSRCTVKVRRYKRKYRKVILKINNKGWDEVVKNTRVHHDVERYWNSNSTDGSI
jgi:hypothetical protein